MHELDYNELTQNKELWENEEALWNGYRSLKSRHLSINEQIEALEKHKKEIAEKCSVVGKQLINLSENNKGKPSLTLIEEGYDLLGEEMQTLFKNPRMKDSKPLDIPLGKSCAVDSIVEELNGESKKI